MSGPECCIWESRMNESKRERERESRNPLPDLEKRKCLVFISPTIQLERERERKERSRKKKRNQEREGGRENEIVQKCLSWTHRIQDQKLMPKRAIFKRKTRKRRRRS